MKTFFLLTFLLSGLNSRAQIYPVQVFIQMDNPHPVYLPDLSRNGNEYLKIHLTFNDLSELSIDVKLQLEVIGNGFTIRTHPDHQPEPISLTSGVPYQVSGAELETYFNPGNMLFTGIDPSDYAESKAFPEGAYSICIKVIHYWNPGQIQISDEICINDWFVLNDPPTPDLPICGTHVPVNELQQIYFQWTPMHLSSPNLTTPPLYKFELWEIYPEFSDPEQISNSTFPLLSVNVDQPYYTYSLLDPILIDGKEYVWKVTAIDRNGAMLFNNVGKSIACSFRYSSVTTDLFTLSLNAVPTSHRQALLWWNTFSFIDNYQLEIRKQGSQNWFPFSSDSSAFRLNDLEPETTYEARIKGVFASEETAWSEIISFVTFSQPVYSCNSITSPPDLLNSPPLQQAHTGMIFKVGQFELKSAAVSSGTNPGYFSGSGTIKVNFGVKLNVEFQSVYIDRNQTIISGEVLALSEGINSWSSQWEYEDAWFYSGSVDSIYTQDGIIYIIDDAGDTTMISEDYSGGLLITDQNGDQWLVNPDGSVVSIPNGGLLPVSNTPMNAQEMEILTRALDLLRNEFTLASRDSMNQITLNKAMELQTHIQSQQNSFITSGENIGDPAFLGYNTTASPSNDAGGSLNRSYKVYEFNSNLSNILYTLAQELNTPNELNYLGRYLTVNSQVFSAFVSQKTADGLSNAQIAELTAENGIKVLVMKIIKKKMSAE